MRNDPQGSATQAHDDTWTEQLARDIYEQIRQLNYATGGPPGLTQPGTVYTVLGNLGAAAYGLNQTIEQLNDFLLHEQDVGRLGHDRDEPTAPAFQECSRALAVARDHIGGLHSALGEAQGTINAIHGIPAPPQKRGVRTAVETAADDFPIPVEESSLTLPVPDQPPPQAVSVPRLIPKEG